MHEIVRDFFCTKTPLKGYIRNVWFCKSNQGHCFTGIFSKVRIETAYKSFCRNMVLKEQGLVFTFGGRVLMK